MEALAALREVLVEDGDDACALLIAEFADFEGILEIRVKCLASKLISNAPLSEVTDESGTVIYNANGMKFEINNIMTHFEEMQYLEQHNRPFVEHEDRYCTVTRQMTSNYTGEPEHFTSPPMILTCPDDPDPDILEMEGIARQIVQSVHYDDTCKFCGNFVEGYDAVHNFHKKRRVCNECGITTMPHRCT